ncbi:unnamed protein product [Dovyalis caffra]|uniref:MYB-CC type transcription factor LHEQLE-containing domain-containing protein n=1 Tax=Dovyalis caffra TaxID=77055 RepID=A0AAV1QR91_9ROSI|nr:unnamed protein product [Dovyalis caffra]
MEGLSGSYLLESPCTGNSSPNMTASDGNEGYEVKEALRVQMEVQSKLHLQVEAEKHLHIRLDAEQRYLAMLEKACKMLADQFIGAAAINTDSQQGVGTKTTRIASIDPLGFYSFQTSVAPEVHGPEDLPPSLHHQGADCSTESCLTSHESPGGLNLEVSPAGGKKGMLSLESATSLIWGDTKMGTPEANATQVNSYGTSVYGMWN